MRHENNIMIEELINSLEHYSVDLKNQKDNAKRHGNSYRNIGMQYALNEIKAIVQKLDELILK